MQSIVRWFVGNPIAANILMIILLVGGWLGSGAIKKEVFPSQDINFININMVYPGAAPSEVEQQIVIRIEEAIAGLPGIFKITSESREGMGQVTVEVIDGYNIKDVLNDLKAQVDAINTFPSSAERPIINQRLFRSTLMYFSISGDASLSIFKELAYRIRDEMPLLDGVSEVNVTGIIEDELAVEISEENLRRFNLRFDDVAAAIRSASLNVPAGTIKSEQGSVQIQTRAQAYDDSHFSNIVVRSFNDGTELLLSDVAKIKDGFAEDDFEFIINGKNGMNFEARLSDDPDLFGGTQNARDYLNEFKKTLPEGLVLKINYENKSLFDARFNMLKDNTVTGLLLVFLILMLFLRPALAMWVVVGIATAFLGALWALPYFDISLNMLSMFAFLMVLGIVVDDAIIVGESIYSRQQQGVDPHLASSEGAINVIKPVMLAVISTVIFFTPMIDVPTTIKPYTISIFFVVFFCLLFSLVETFLILPSHLSHMRPEKAPKNGVFKVLSDIRHFFSEGMVYFAKNIYQPVLQKTMQRSGSTFVGFFSVFLISFSLYIFGWVGNQFFPSVDQPFVMVDVTYPEGSPYRYSTDLAKHLTVQANAIKNDKAFIDQNEGKAFIHEINTTTRNNSVGLFIGLTPTEERSVTVTEVADRLRELIGPLPEVKSYNFQTSFSGNAPDIALNLRLSSNSPAKQREVVNDIQKVLGAYPGVSNVRSDLDTGRLEVELSLKPYAQTLGISMAEIASQVRQAFYGEEVQRIPRSKEDVKVMLRYSVSERRTLDTLDDMRIRTADRQEIPLSSVANIDLVPGASTIRRTDRFRNISLTADVADGFDANQITNEMLAAYTEEWQKKHAGFKLSTEGNLRAQAEFGDNFVRNFLLTLVVTYALFAIVFRSLFQPFLILLAVPFGFMGAIIGHLLFGLPITMMSFFGFMACSGVVVNDNLVLLDRINQLRAQGLRVVDAVATAGVDRFRPIVLTSITTFVGLLPIMFETSTQAQFLIPMVIALAFGVLFASGVTLILVPCTYKGGYALGERLKRFGSNVYGKLIGTKDRETSVS